ncbi:MAG TPA: hypothetical protein VFC00_15830 [Micromonosporaceae bacterium]|nr:hypothetical protein [Micromonosporaceae bacterium]
MDVHGTDGPVGWLVVLLHKELRIAWVAALDRGVDPVELSRSIAERLRRLRPTGASGRAGPTLIPRPES